MTNRPNIDLNPDYQENSQILTLCERLGYSKDKIFNIYFDGLLYPPKKIIQDLTKELQIKNLAKL